MLGHQADGILARRRRFFHIHLAIQLVTRVEKDLVVSITDQCIQFCLAETLIQVNLFVFRALVAEETPRVAAGGSGRF